MNNGSTGQNAQGSPPAQQNPQASLIRPEQVRNLPNINDQQKAQYEDGIRKLWNVIQSRPADSPEHQQAQTKLVEISQNIKNSYRKYQAQQAALQRAQQAQTQQGGQGGQGGQAATPRPTNTAQPAANPQASNTQSQAQQQIQAHLQSFPFTLPPNIPQGSPESEKWLSEAKLRYGQALQKQEVAVRNLKQLQSFADERQRQGKPFSPEEQAQFEQRRQQYSKSHQESKKFIESFRHQQKEFATQQNSQARQGGAPPAQGRPVPQSPQPQPVNQPPATGTNAPPSTTAVDIARQQANTSTRSPMSPSAVAGQGTMASASQQSSNPVNTAQNNIQHSTVNNTAVPPVPQQPPPVTQPAPQPVSLPQTHQSPHENVPQSAHPQSTPQQGPPRPLSHQAAMAEAARSYSNGFAQNGVTPSQSGYRGDQSTTSNVKMPIPKNLNVSQPQPVAMGPARPTLTGGAGNVGMGMMGQPAITKHPGYVLEGEGERVLSQKKLAELVRQVTGGSEELAPDVEECVLQLADDFIDNVVTAACRLAKLRGSNVLDLRDIQLILERNYNIRIPGYASDELRTVRKFQPAQGWNAKMSAVAASKVTGGKADI